MARRKPIDRSEQDFKFDRLLGVQSHHARHDGPDIYREAYNKTLAMTKAGKSPGEISTALKPKPPQLPLKADGTELSYAPDHRANHETDLRIVEDAVNDALAGRAANFDDGRYS